MENSIIVKEKDFLKARKKIRESKGKKIIFTSWDDDLNRKVLEKEKIGVLLLNQSLRRDKTKQRESGLNHVLSKIAKKNDVVIGINFDEFTEYNGKKKSEIIGRVIQNVKLCNKNKLKMAFVYQNNQNKRNINDLKSLGLVLGMPTWMTKSLTSF